MLHNKEKMIEMMFSTRQSKNGTVLQVVKAWDLKQGAFPVCPFTSPK